MATPGQLVTRLSEILSVPEETVTVFDRVLREAGMVTKGGRGRSAPHRTAEDTARIVIALLATSSPARAAEAAEDFRILTEMEGSPKRGAPEMANLHTACALQPGHTLEAAIVALIEALGDPARRARFEGPDIRQLTIEVSQTNLEAIVRCNGHEHQYEHPAATAFYDAEPPSNGGDIGPWIAADDAWLAVQARHRGIRTTRFIGYSELAAIAVTISDRAPHA